MGRLVFASAVALAVACLASACGTVTGLSDDFQFVDDAAVDGASSSSSGGGGDASGDAPGDARNDARSDSGGACSPVAAGMNINDTSGNDLPPGCALCLASSCCHEIVSCYGNGSTVCRGAMDCVFKCQNRTSAQERQNCASMCAGLTAFGDVAACEASGCSSSMQCNGKFLQ